MEPDLLRCWCAKSRGAHSSRRWVTLFLSLSKNPHETFSFNDKLIQSEKYGSYNEPFDKHTCSVISNFVTILAEVSQATLPERCSFNILGIIHNAFREKNVVRWYIQENFKRSISICLQMGKVLQRSSYLKARKYEIFARAAEADKDTSMSKRVGQLLGNYRLIRQLGKGGFGKVYLGEHVYLKTQAAIKVLLDNPESINSDAFRASFLQEAQRIAQLKHPHILRILDFGMHEELNPFLVLEYAVNGTLLQRHTRGIQVGLTTVIAYVKQLAQALQYAHTARLIHRDVKPANVLLSEQETLLLSDFGIATIAHHTSTMKTQGYVGTPAYMAPEQLRGKPVTASDQYALAVMVYEWLCGQLPYVGDPISVGMQHLIMPVPSLRALNVTLSPQVEFVVQTALAKDPRQRFANIMDFADALALAKEAKNTFFSTLPMTAINDIELQKQFLPATAPLSNSLPPTLLVPKLLSSKQPVQPIQTAWDLLQDDDERHLFLFTSSFPETASIPLWLVELAMGRDEQDDGSKRLKQACQHLQELSLFEEVTDEKIRLHPQKWAFGRQMMQTTGDMAPVEEAIQRLLRTFTELDFLEQRAQEIGYYEIEKQLRVVRAYLNMPGMEDQMRQVAQVKRWLDRESYLLSNKDWWPGTLSNLFYQQLYNRSVEAGIPLMMGREPDRWIRQRGQVDAEDQSLLRIFAYSLHLVSSVAFSPSGQYVLTGLFDNTARLWDVGCGRELRRFEGHTNWVLSVAFSPDGRLILTGSADETARIWDTESGRELRRLVGHADWVNSVAFSPNGRLALTGSSDTTARLWEVSSGRGLRRLEGHMDRVFSVAFSPDGRLSLTGSADETARLWELSSGHELWRLKGHTSQVHSVAFSSDGRLALTGSHDKTARLWEISSGHELRKLEGHMDWVNSVAFSPNGQLALTGSSDTTARLWDVDSGRELRKLEGHIGEVSSVAFSSDGRLALTGSHDETVRLWNVNNRQEIRNIKDHTMGINSVVFSPDGRLALTGGDDHTASLWDVDSGRELRKLEGHTGRVTNVAFSADGHLALTGSGDRTAHDKTVRLWEVNSGHELWKLEGHTYGVSNMTFSPYGGMLLTTGLLDSTARLWDISNGRGLRKLEGHTAKITLAIFSPDGQLALTASDDHTVRLWNVYTGRELHRLDGYTNGITNATFSPTGEYILIGAADNTAQLWDVDSGQKLRKLEGHTDKIMRIAFSPDSQLALTTSNDHTARLWNVDIGYELQQLEGQLQNSLINYIDNVVFSPDGRFVLGRDIRGWIYIWRTQEPQPGKLLGIYTASYQIGAVYWQDANHLRLADLGGQSGYPHFYQLTLEGSWE